MNRRCSQIALFATIVLAFLLRVWNLAGRSIWFDEAFSWTVCSEFGPLEIIRRTSEDVHPPFFYLTLWAWMHVVGDSLWAMRFLSVVCGTVSVFVADRVGREAMKLSADSSPPLDEPNVAADRVVGSIFAMLVATSAFQIHWSGEVRMYALLTLLFLLSVYFGLRALNNPKAATRPLMAFAVTSALMLYTHNYGLFSFIAVSAALVLMAWYRERSRADVRANHIAGRMVLAAGVAGLLFVPWIPSLLHQRSQVAANYWISRFSLTQLAIAWDGVIFPETTYGTWQKTRGQIAIAITVTLLAALQVRARAVDFLSLVLTALPAMLAIGISVTSTSIIAYRLFVLIHLSALLAVARGLQKWLEPFAAMAMAVVLMADGLWLHGECVRQMDVHNRPGPRGAMEWLDSVGAPEETICVLHSCVYFSLRYHARNRDHILLCTPEENIVHYTGKPILKTGERQDLTAMIQESGRRVWIVDCTGYSAGYRRPFLPQSLKWKSEQRFDSPYSFEGDVIVSEYVVDAADDTTRQESSETKDGK